MLCVLGYPSRLDVKFEITGVRGHFNRKQSATPTNKLRRGWMLLRKEIVSERIRPTYAIAGDFCRVFAEDMESLYLLAFLLTADHETAERCFVTALGDCVSANRVFQEWARSWARRAVIQSAIRMMQPIRHEGRQLVPPHPPADKAAEFEEDPSLTAVLQLNTFQRFVFVMSVLEGYPDNDCRLLLGVSREAVVRARAQAARSIAASGQMRALSGEPSARAFLSRAS